MMTESNRDHSVSVLLVGDYRQDRATVIEVFRKLGWKLFEARNRRKALRCLDHHAVHVVLAESDLPHWSWRRVLRDLRRMPLPPQLVVTSRVADDYLWSKVLNVGGFDVLAQPLEAEELERVIASARRHYGVPPQYGVPPR